MSDRIERLLQLMECLGITKYSLSTSSGIGPSNFSKMLDGEQTITDKTLHKIVAAYPQINLAWLKTGEGEMLNPAFPKTQTVGSGIGIQGNVGRDLTQMTNSKKLFDDFTSILKAQSRLLEKSLDQTDRVIAEMTENRKMMQNLIDLLTKSKN